jgi:translation initiation factor 3 subunit A
MEHPLIDFALMPYLFQVRGWDGWSSESIALHLQTRFAQLETASNLKLYTESFRTVEDISSIMTISNQRRKYNSDFPPPKAKLMAKYYEQLIELFWVSENYLFHAFAWYKYYVLCKEYNKSMSDELKAQQASAVLLAALCIPSLPTKSDDGSGSYSNDNRFMDSIMQEKMGRMATLLGFATRNPSRESLLEEINSQGIFSQVPSYLKDLYHLLEEGSDPLVVVEVGKPLLDQINQQAGDDCANSLVGRYAQPLGNVLLLKLLWNLSSAYHTVKIEFLKTLTEGLGMSFESVEKSIVLFTQTHKGLAVRIDHRAECLRFGETQLESDAMRSQLTVLGQQLEKVVSKLAPDSSKAKAAESARIYQSVRDIRDVEHAKLLERKARIEHRKEEIERLAQEKLKKEQQQAAAAEAARKAEEERRIQREHQLRETEKKKKIEMELENGKKEKLLQALGYNTDAMTAEQVAATDAEKLQKEHQDKINQKREEAERKTRDAAKQLDYLVRAIRIEELPLIKKKYDEKVKQDREQYEKEVVEKAKLAKEQWESDIKEKERLLKHNVFMYMKGFQGKVMEGRRLKHVVICREADKEAELRAEKDKLKRARKRKQDEQKRIADEEARLKREEEERIADEDRRKKEEARRQREAEEEERRKQEAARMAEERERKDRQQDDIAPRSSKALESATSGSGGGGEKYVPPSLRGAGGGGRFDDKSGGGSRFGDKGAGNNYPGGGRYTGRPDRRAGGPGYDSTDRGGSGSGYGNRDRGGPGKDWSDRGGSGSGYGNRDRGGPGNERVDRGGSGGGYGHRDRGGPGNDRSERGGSGGGYGNRDRSGPGDRSGSGSGYSNRDNRDGAPSGENSRWKR